MKSYNLFELTELIKNICEAHPLVNDFFTNKFRINDTDDISYPAISFSVNSVTSNTNTLSFDVNLLYADRLTDRRDNEIAAQTTGISCIIEIVNVLKSLDVFEITDGYTLTPFTEQFADNCAGVFATLNITVPHYIGECEWVDKTCINCI